MCYKAITEAASKQFQSDVIQVAGQGLKGIKRSSWGLYKRAVICFHGVPECQQQS